MRREMRPRNLILDLSSFYRLHSRKITENSPIVNFRTNRGEPLLLLPYYLYLLHMNLSVDCIFFCSIKWENTNGRRFRKLMPLPQILVKVCLPWDKSASRMSLYLEKHEHNGWLQRKLALSKIFLVCIRIFRNRIIWKFRTAFIWNTNVFFSAGNVDSLLVHLTITKCDRKDLSWTNFSKCIVIEIEY